MRRFYRLFLALGLGTVGSADSRIWPPRPFSLMSDSGSAVVRFIPKVRGESVVATRILSFSFDEREAAYVLAFDREIPGFWEPDYACAAKDPSVLVLLFFRPDRALVILDTATKKIVLSKSFQELVPDFSLTDYRDRTVSTLRWCGPPLKRDGKLFLPGGVLDRIEANSGPSFIVDLGSYQVTRQLE